MATIMTAHIPVSHAQPGWSAGMPGIGPIIASGDAIGAILATYTHASAARPPIPAITTARSRLTAASNTTKPGWSR
jgi:hypothetical protein